MDGFESFSNKNLVTSQNRRTEVKNTEFILLPFSASVVMGRPLYQVPTEAVPEPL